ncbi:UDP-glucose/GDP-mannose dehydrogenase family protein [bacterium AH-315-I18]|nr:UDP-glucose/GDP-mannose dehydrogenase family protein [bacterium AH-315-I18]
MTLNQETTVKTMPTVAMIGMGYVGAVSSAALASQGCHVIGVEVQPTKLKMLQSGQSPVFEPGLQQLVSQMHASGKLDATDDLTAAVKAADIIMVAVGTPSNAQGQVNLDAINRVTDQLAMSLHFETKPRVVMIRSTVPPGTVATHIVPKLKASCPNIAVCHHPEFLREGSALKDWHQPPMIVWGSDDPSDRVAVDQAMHTLYQNVDAPHLPLASRESELMKYACNIFHAIKIDFANEIGALANALGADPAKVMHAFSQDTKLNISPAYLKPGFAFGGSCLPKDTRAMMGKAHEFGIDLPLISSVLDANKAQLKRGVDAVLSHGRQRTLLLGLTFKAGTDDLRESPMVDLAEQLLGKGIALSIYDPDLIPENLIGANAVYVAQHLPHLKMLLRDDLQSALADAQVVVITKSIQSLQPEHLVGKTVIDLTGQGKFTQQNAETYQQIPNALAA